MNATQPSNSPLSDPALLQVVIVNYNGNATLPATIAGLMEAGIQPEQIIVSDDGSTDGSVERAQRDWPGIRLVRRPRNCGIVNKVRNAGLSVVSSRYVFLTDNDIIVGPGNLERLLAVLQAAPDRAIVTPRLVDVARRDEIFYDGKHLHFLALSCNPARGRPVNQVPEEPLRPTFGGGIMMIDVSLGRRIGWMDAEYREGWASDAEIQLRARAFGYEALHDSRVTMLHFGKNHGTKRALGQMSNRYRLILTYYSLRTLILLLPSLLVFELLLVLAAIRIGVFGQWLEAVRKTLRARHDLSARRAELKARRRRSDAELLRRGAFELPGVVRDNPVYRHLMHVARLPFECNWLVYRLVSRLWEAKPEQRRHAVLGSNSPGNV